ncbi:hypothetical protein Hdeb2414_s0010g00339111 [Helianthus debilis subsp. tardiflorus]
MASKEMSLKLLVDVKGSRVLFAEVSKEFVDFLFHIFSLPLGTLVELIGSNQMAGCLGKLKGSIESFHANYLQPGIKMDDIFNPKTAFNNKTFLLSYDASSEVQSGASKAVYRCSNAAAHFAPPNQVAETQLADEIKKRGYVKEVVTYMVMDDLVVNPMSTISGITLINKFGVKDLSQLEEKNVSFGKDEGLRLLEASLKTNKVLTTVFLH